MTEGEKEAERARARERERESAGETVLCFFADMRAHTEVMVRATMRYRQILYIYIYR